MIAEFSYKLLMSRENPLACKETYKDVKTCGVIE